jgi:hypothetical protein
MSELKLRPPKKQNFSANLRAAGSFGGEKIVLPWGERDDREPAFAD